MVAGVVEVELVAVVAEAAEVVGAVVLAIAAADSGFNKASNSQKRRRVTLIGF